MLLELSEIKRQLRLEEDYTEEDELLTLISRAVEARTVTFLNRTLYEASVPGNDPDGLVITDDIRMGMLLLATHFYENRSSVSEVEKMEMPQSYTWLVGPYRFIPL
ncbi:TPA: phage gp6-like head-tail connector protein [Citrobacter freundii]|uniref:head-tail connector protein n=1 Tax=Citrobacter TaxID=544 RepID=UPI000D101E6A|nr:MULTISPECIES: head-tail connector protein [Citrobacter]PSF22316.1 phage gp6-like head-tail connector protein [Escherichia coli]EKY0312601.1 phage gp6-like head-tail connector protein [Citrobacter freundii]MBJ8402536.1 phage gp6-like head-tail connector protein [Citrobacter youngae]MBJ9361961.1 phage gp6-like head-tail connector protein [Citrobacter freundii]MBJ9604854.1 phage gp6-like head-tail connector protein [Citrobacter sp. FDAARGOS_156]